MKEHPILFSAPMVRALLDGSKTQTRRVVKPRKDRFVGCELAAHELAGEVNGGDYTNSLYKPGDRLWVRETWAGPLVDNDRWEASTDAREFEKPEFCAYRADGGPTPEFLDADENLRQRWTPAIHMFRWASRIALDLTGVRVEKLQDINRGDATAEGITSLRGDGYGLPDGSHFHATDPRISYWSLWDAINGAGAAARNPWVWVIEFRRAQ